MAQQRVTPDRLNTLPPRVSSIRGFVAGPAPFQLAGPNSMRNGFLIQNRDAANFMFVTFYTAANADDAFMIPPTGQLSIDFVMPDAIWVFASAASTKGVIFESSGLDPGERATIAALGDIAQSLKILVTRNGPILRS